MLQSENRERRIPVNLRERYGEWGVVLGAAEGIGKAICEKLAEGGMNVIMVDRRDDLLPELGQDLSTMYGVETKSVKADFSEPDAADSIFAASEGLDLGFMSYVASMNAFGDFAEIPWEKHVRALQVNVGTFLACFYHYMKIFTAQNRGGVINIASVNAISGSPWNGQYAAGKAYILKLTESVAGETEKTNVDVLAVTLGTTLTPNLLRNLPDGPMKEVGIKRGMTSEAVAEEAFSALGRRLSVIAGEMNREEIHEWQSNHTADEFIRFRGRMAGDPAVRMKG